MAEESKPDKTPPSRKGFTAFFLKRAIFAIVLIAAVLYVLSLGIEQLGKWQAWKQKDPSGQTGALAFKPAEAPPAGGEPPALPAPPPPPGMLPSETDAAVPHAATVDLPLERPAEARPQAPTPPASEPSARQVEPPREQHQAPSASPAPTPELQEPAVPRKDGHGGSPPRPDEKRPLGVAFVEAVISPLYYELNQRFYGWRPNDIINVTDNVNQFQLGVLEVTRRTVVQLAERLSRTGYNDAFDRNLENAMNFLMIKADSYWFPSPESKYKESLDELEIYKKKLLAERASFHIRADNIIPLFAAFEDLLGSCDENLVKLKEPDGSKVGHFKADNYFYYAKGVASAMATILEAAQRDFSNTLENRRAAELLHHAITYCRLASNLEPWIVTNAGLDGILANHRANLAAPISHARYYMGQLIKTLST